MHPCAGCARCSARTPACVMAASPTSAATTTIESMAMIRMILGTSELRFYRVPVSQTQPRSFPHYSEPCHTNVAGHFITMISTFLELPACAIGAATTSTIHATGTRIEHKGDPTGMGKQADDGQRRTTRTRRKSGQL